jgi:hypothetical protein
MDDEELGIDTLPEPDAEPIAAEEAIGSAMELMDADPDIDGDEPVLPTCAAVLGPPPATDNVGLIDTLVARAFTQVVGRWSG